MERNPNNLSFLEHLDELRGRLIKSCLAVVITTGIFYFFLDQTLTFMIKPVGKVVFTSPFDAFMARLTLLFFGGLFLALPYVIYQIWQFVAEGLSEEEKKYIRIFAPASFILFALGLLFAYLIVIPTTIRFLLSYASEQIIPMITVKSYISFIGTFMLSFGVIFELPLIILFLTKIGIATPAFLVQKRRHAIVLIFIVSAILTPPDVISQLMMAIPLVVLYELGVIFSKLTYKNEIVISGKF